MLLESENVQKTSLPDCNSPHQKVLSLYAPSLSGEQYQVRCPNQEPVKSAKWLADQVHERRMVKQDRSS